MPADLSNTLSVAVSARALFDPEEDHRFFERKGVEAYRAYQKARFDRLPGRAQRSRWSRPCSASTGPSAARSSPSR